MKPFHSLRNTENPEREIMMKHRWTAILLVLCLAFGLVPTASAAYSYGNNVDEDRLVQGGIAMYSSNENTYDGVTSSDSGAVGMGILGWRGPKALELLKMICAKDPSGSKSALGTALYNEVVNTTNLAAWNNRTFSSTEVAAAKKVISTDLGRACQNELARSDILYQVNEAWNQNIRSDAAILYYCSVCNHYGPGGAKTFMTYIRNTMGISSSDTINSLDDFHNAVVQAAKTYSYVSGPNNYYITYRTKIYNFIKNNLKWNTSGVVFSDMPTKGHWAYDAILWAYNSTPRITTGTSATTFSPDNTVTRGEAITFLWRAAGCPEPGSVSNPFKDVASGKFYYKAVLWGVQKGIVAGTSATTFAPNDTVLRGQMLTFLWRYAGKPNVPANSVPFTDTPSDKYYYKAVVWAYWGGILVGNEGGSAATKLQPNALCTRAYAVTYLFNEFVMTQH